MAADGVLPRHREMSTVNAFKQRADEGLARAGAEIQSKEKSGPLMPVAPVTRSFPRETSTF